MEMRKFPRNRVERRKIRKQNQLENGSSLPATLKILSVQVVKL